MYEGLWRNAKAEVANAEAGMSQAWGTYQGALLSRDTYRAEVSRRYYEECKTIWQRVKTVENRLHGDFHGNQLPANQCPFCLAGSV